MDNKQKEKLIQAAWEARQRAYAPYSRFRVGAALLTEDGSVYTGCNVENASYGACICAERVAAVEAVKAGKKSFAAIAVVGGEETCYPCGICRQFLAEFGPKMTVLCGDGQGGYEEHTLSGLLPAAFIGFTGEK